MEDETESDLTESDGKGHGDTLLAAGSDARTMDVDSSPLPSSDSVERLPLVPRDPYDIGEPFAKGGIGKISEAIDRRLDRKVAIKELRRSTRYSRMRFAREIHITAKLQHPNIVQLHEAGRWPDGEPFFAMKLVEGDSLEGSIESCVTMADHLRLIDHVRDVADAMAHAHSRGIVHRDLKPGNVLVGPFGETVVIDWGLAKDLADGSDDLVHDPPPTSNDTLVDRYETTEGVILGTPAYMPPEQAAGRMVDERADVYALGAILYQALSGRAPYFEYHPKRVLERVVATPPSPLAKIQPDLPKDLLAIVSKAMSRNVEERYRTAQEMAAELHRYAGGSLVSAYRYSISDLVRRFVSRHRAAVGTALVAAAVLAGFGMWSFRRIAGERDAAEDARRSEAQARALEADARAVAERRLDDAVLSAARADLDRDPTRALARLKRLGVIVDGAATVAADAMERGVATHVLHGHSERIDALAYSPNGRFVASSGIDGVIRLFVRDRNETLRLEKHEARVPVLAFAGDTLVSADYRGLIVMWDASTGAVKSSTVGHANKEIRAIAVHGDKVATVAEDGVRVWNTASGKAALAFEKSVERTAFAAFVPDANRLVTGSHDGDIRVWDLVGEDHWSLSGHDGGVNAAAVSPDGKRLVSAGEDGDVIHWDLDTRKSRRLGHHLRGAHVVRFIDATRVVSGGMDGRVVVRNLDDGETMVIAQHEERVTALATHEGHVASAGWDKRIVLVDTAFSGRRILSGHDSVVSALAFSPDGKELASASWDRTVRLWPAADTARLIPAHDVGVKTIASDARGERLASGGHDDLVRIWNASTGQLERTLVGHEDHVFRVMFSPDGSMVASSSDDRTVRLWTVADGDHRTFRGHSADVEELDFSPDGSWLASAGEDAKVGLWRVGEGDEGGVLDGHSRAVTAVHFTPDGSRLVSASLDGDVLVWDVATRKEAKRLSLHSGGVTALDVSANGLVATTGKDERVRLWDMEGEAQEVAAVVGADRVAVSRDGSEVAVSSTSGLITLCAIGEVSACRSLVGHEERVHTLRFVPEQSLLTSASEDGTVRVWSTKTGESRPIRVHSAPVFDLALVGTRVASASGDRSIGISLLVGPPQPGDLREALAQWTSMTLPSFVNAGASSD